MNDKQVKYTEGPLSISVSKELAGRYEIKNKSGFTIGMVFPKTFPEIGEYGLAKANAKLWSLSPELAYMLKWLTGGCEGLIDQGTMSPDGPFAHAVSDARALLERLP